MQWTRDRAIGIGRLCNSIGGLKIAGGAFHKIHMGLSWAILNTPLKCLLPAAGQWQMRLQISHIFKPSNTAFCLDPPFGSGVFVGVKIITL